MARRSFDFTKSQKKRIKAAYSHICAACGSDDPMMLSADHWVAGDKNDTGVCLCIYCNCLKSDSNIPQSLRLDPREKLKVIGHDEFSRQIAENRKAWGKWVARFAGTNRVKAIAFVSPY